MLALQELLPAHPEFDWLCVKVHHTNCSSFTLMCEEGFGLSLHFMAQKSSGKATPWGSIRSFQAWVLLHSPAPI